MPHVVDPPSGRRNPSKQECCVLRRARPCMGHSRTAGVGKTGRAGPAGFRLLSLHGTQICVCKLALSNSVGKVSDKAAGNR